MPSHPIDPSFLLNSGLAEKTQASAEGSKSLSFKDFVIKFLTSFRRFDKSFVSLIEGKLNLDIYNTYFVN